VCKKNKDSDRSTHGIQDIRSALRWMYLVIKWRLLYKNEGTLRLQQALISNSPTQIVGREGPELYTKTMERLGLYVSS